MKKTLKRIVTCFLILSLLLPVMSLVSFANDDRPVTIIEEDISKRSEKEKHFICSDGSIVAVSYSLPVHRQNEAGIFEEIDNRLSYDPLTKCYENKNNGSFSVSLAASGQGKAVTVRAPGAPVLSFSTTAVKNGAPLAKKLGEATFTAQTAQTAEKMSFSGQKLSKADFTLNFVSSSLTVQGSDVSGRYTLVGDGVKEDVIVQTPGVTAFVTEYTVSSLTLTSDKDGSLIFKNEKGEPVYSVSAPYTYDAAGSECPDTAVTFTRTADGYRVLYTPDARWMASEERVYPITFDPLLEEKTLTSSQLTQKTYTDNGSTVTVTGNKLKLSYDRTVSPRVRSSAGITLSSSAYPTINTDVYRINSVQLTLTVLTTEGFTGNFPFAVYQLSENDHPEEAGFTPTRYQKISSGIVTPTTAKCTFDLSAEDYEADALRSYLIQPSSTTVSGNVEFGNTSSARTARPVLKVYYSLKEDFTGKTCYISRTDNGVTRYLSVKETASGAYTVCGDTLPYRWVFAYDHYHDGDYMLRSVEHPNLYLSSDGGITVKYYSASYITDHDAFWTPMPAGGGYLFCPYSGSGFLHLNPSGGSVTLSTSSGIDEHTWNVTDFVPETDFAEEMCYISKTDNEVTRYLSVQENASGGYSVGIDTLPYRWIFEAANSNGDYLIRSVEHPSLYLKAGSGISVTTCGENPDSSLIWAPTSYQNGCLFWSYSGSGFLHLNTADNAYTATLDHSSDVAGHIWNVTELVSQSSGLDVGNFTFVNLTTEAHLTVNPGSTAAPQRSATAPDNVNKTWTAEKLEDGSYQFIIQDSSEKFLQASNSSLEIGTNSDNSKWLVDIDYQTGGYTVQNVATGHYLADQNNTLTLLPSLPDSKAGCLWKFKDFFALTANPEDKVEFALHNLFDNSYLQYNSIFSDTSLKTLVSATFNPVVDETVANAQAKHGYTARTLGICQRFTFEKVGEGEDAYYHILPYLRLQEGTNTEVKGSYRSEYRLVADGSSVKMAQISETNGTLEDPLSGRWKLIKTAGGMYEIISMATSTPKYLGIFGSLTTQSEHTLWNLKALCLNVEKDYQRKRNTCGAANGTMVVNYFLDNANRITESTFMEGLSSSVEISTVCTRINQLQNQVIYNSGAYNYYKNDALAFHTLLSKNLDNGYPVIVNIAPKKDPNDPNDLEDLIDLGYAYTSDGGHYIVAKGIYYNSILNRYEYVCNDCHYKFGDDTSLDSTCACIGGRDLVISDYRMHKIYKQRYGSLCYVVL